MLQSLLVINCLATLTLSSVLPRHQNGTKPLQIKPLHGSGVIKVPISVDNSTLKKRQDDTSLLNAHNAYLIQGSFIVSHHFNVLPLLHIPIFGECPRVGK